MRNGGSLICIVNQRIKVNSSNDSYTFFYYSVECSIINRWYSVRKF